MIFTRTPTGLSEKWRFHRMPTIWVEGPTDIFFYEPILKDLACRMEAFHGKENSAALVDALIESDYPYLVILDGDYSILRSVRAKHRNVVILSRYSIENFLWESEAVNRACLRHARCGDSKDLLVSEMDRVAAHVYQVLHHAIVLDIAARESPEPMEVLPDAIDVIQADKRRPDADPAKVQAISADAEANIDSDVISSADASLRKFLRSRSVMHVLRGHLLLSILRRVFFNAAAAESGKNVVFPNDVLVQLLADRVWEQCRAGDHARLRRNIREKVRRLMRDAYELA